MMICRPFYSYSHVDAARGLLSLLCLLFFVRRGGFTHGAPFFFAALGCCPDVRPAAHRVRSPARRAAHAAASSPQLWQRSAQSTTSRSRHVALTVARPARSSAARALSRAMCFRTRFASLRRSCGISIVTALVLVVPALLVLVLEPAEVLLLSIDEAAAPVARAVPRASTNPSSSSAVKPSISAK